ncbi:MAG TPA: cytochrome b/b6 domain-containing protein [Bryobacteraceae bacterium]|nr:cytochrome b/b6 domain-containing protein [Bryobacteraceae bacterium]
MSTAAATNPVAESNYYTRFSPGQRILHAVLVFTFLGLAATGLPLRFSSAAWSVGLAHAVGGFSAILFFHKFCAVVLTIDFLIHVVDIVYRTVVKKQWGLLWGTNSMVPNLKDAKDLFAQMRWFLFLGPKPKFDRYTYWEKLDYWGVFWGMAIIGISGYAMWFSGAFARIVPGSWLNVALLIHGEEALLAVGYIFVVHFFNEHLRPNNFPMDITIFTGSQTEEEFRERHPEEYARAAEAGQLKQLRAEAPPAWAVRTSRLLGSAAVVIGVVLIVLTAEAFLRD